MRYYCATDSYWTLRQSFRFVERPAVRGFISYQVPEPESRGQSHSKEDMHGRYSQHQSRETRQYYD